jgi:hypothetical protein
VFRGSSSSYSGAEDDKDPNQALIVLSLLAKELAFIFKATRENEQGHIQQTHRRPLKEAVTEVF